MRTELRIQIVRRLAEHESRFTPARRLVAEALAEGNGPSSAADLHESLGESVPLSSLYRTLTVLDESGIVQRTHDGDGVARYELAEWLAGHHHHLVCASCGEVADVAVDPRLEEVVEEAIATAAGKTGFLVTGHRVDLEGLCRSCRPR